ncbi:MAG: 3-oxoacyl-ACP reductase family protein [Bacillota bacterium]|jgi:3-oxoacyl-[acyl-carrier protein] reductase
MLKDKVALVTGGSGGIGRCIVAELARRGARVAFTYCHSESDAFALQEQLHSEGLELFPIKLDVANFAEVKSGVAGLIGRWGQIDILVNNAGIAKDKSLLMLPPEEWREVLETNLTGIYNVTKHCLFYMLKRKTGRIVNVSSTSGITGLPGQCNYSASKAGIVGFTRALAKETAAYGIAVNAVAPGGVKTRMITKMTEQAREALLAHVPLHRFCEPEEVANVVIYLASESPAYLTGSVIVLDGGAGVG